MNRFVALILFSCLLLAPWLASALSDKEAAKIGRETYEQVTARIPVYADDELSEYVAEVGQRLVAASDEPDQTFIFTLLDSPDINAFATPGGYIYINRGLIAYLQSEAQLAAVLAHEIAHITARHATRQRRAQTASNVAAGLVAILTGSGEVGEATALWGGAAVRGYGRDMELEADGLGARFMAKAGYNPQAVIEVLGLLKDHQRQEALRARESGEKRQTYHGLFATHPRHDTRLREVVSGAGDLLERGDGEKGTMTFRMVTDGLVWGRNFAAPEPDNRFSHEELRFRFDYPEGWTFREEDERIFGTGPEGKATLTLEIRSRTLAPPATFIRQTLGIHPLGKSQSVSPAGLRGHTGLIPGADDAPDKRLAVIYFGRRAFVFTGEPDGPELTAQLDDSFLRIIGSFAPLSRAMLANRDPQRIRYVKATEGTTFAALSDHLDLGEYGEAELRLINGYYPAGEPKAGEWIKIIR